MMKLFYAPTSPFARKVLVVAKELGLTNKLQTEEITTSPVTQNAALARENPLARIPTLALEDGEVLYDSRVIVEYLDLLADGGKVIPATGQPRMTALRRQALADGISDTLVAVRYELALRPEGLRWDTLIVSQFDRVRRSLTAMEDEAHELSTDTPNIGEIAIVCMLGYLDFRFSDFGWTGSAPYLAKWYAIISSRESFRTTAPK